MIELQMILMLVFLMDQIQQEFVLRKICLKQHFSRNPREKTRAQKCVKDVRANEGTSYKKKQQDREGKCKLEG